MSGKRTITFEIQCEWIERLLNAVAEVEGRESTDKQYIAACIATAVMNHVRALEQEIEYERRRMEEYDDSDITF